MSVNKWLHLIFAVITGTASYTLTADVHTIQADVVSAITALQTLFHVVSLFTKKAAQDAQTTSAAPSASASTQSTGSVAK